MTSGAYGHTLGAAVGLGYVGRRRRRDAGLDRGGRFEIEVAGRRVAARASLSPMYDPKGARMKA